MPQTHRGWKGQAVCEKRLRTKEENPGNPNNPPGPIASVPEPITALLLGIGICLTTGFIVTKKKQKS
jgi:hypothetical protein